jgi:hypothetical protein
MSSTSAGRFVRLVLLASLAGSAVNVAAIVVTPPESQAMVRHDGAELGDVLAGEQPFVAQRYELFGHLRAFAGARIEVPGDLLDDYVLEHLSQLEPQRVERRRRVPEQVLDDLAGAIRAEGLSEIALGSDDIREFAVAARGESPELLVVYVTRRSGTILVVDRALAEEQDLP